MSHRNDRRSPRGDASGNSTNKSTLPAGTLQPGTNRSSSSAGGGDRELNSQSWVGNDGQSMRPKRGGGGGGGGGGASISNMNRGDVRGNNDDRSQRQQKEQQQLQAQQHDGTSGTQYAAQQQHRDSHSHNARGSNNRDGGRYHAMNAPKDAFTSSRNDDEALREQVRAERGQRRKAAQIQPMLCGFVVSLRDSFGFVQPFASVKKDEINSKSDIVNKVNQLGEQIYFSDREAYRDIAVGHEVYYTLKETPKGPQGSMLRQIPQSNLISTYQTIPDSAGGVTNSREKSLVHTDIKDNDGNGIVALMTVKGVIVKDCEPNRNNLPGLIHVTSCIQAGSDKSESSSAKDSHSKKKESKLDLPEHLMQVGLVSFTMNDISRYTKSSTSANSGAPHSYNPPVMKGDEVTFQYRYAHSPARDYGENTTFPLYIRAALVTLCRSAKDMRAEMVLDELISSKTKREQGIVESVRGSEGYGFIKPVDRAEPIFFRLDSLKPCSAIAGSTDNSIPDEEVEMINGVPVNEPKNRDHLSGRIYDGLEVEFFVVAEKVPVRNKPSTEAFGITTLAKGTIEFEQTIAKNAVATVVVEPRLHPREEPGTLQLEKPIEFEDSDGKKLSLTEIELWSRCAPDGLVFRIGDVIELDVNHYRPEKLQFARNIRMKAYRKMSRHTGRVCSIRDEGYGFIKLSDSVLDDMVPKENCYFRLSEVVSAKDGSMLTIKQITMGMPLSFEILLEEVRNREVRCRGMRVMQLDALHDDEHDDGTSSLLLISEGVRGKVTRDSNKKDSPGSILMEAGGNNSSSAKEGETGEGTDPMRDSQIQITREKILDNLKQFRDIASKSSMLEIMVEQISVAEVRLYFEILTSNEYSEPNGDLYGMVCEIATRSASNGHLSTGLQAVKIYLVVSPNKMKSQQNDSWKSKYAQWLKDSRAMLADSAARFAEQQNSNSLARKESNKRDPRRDRRSMGNSDDVTFVKSDTSEALGVVARDLFVTFDLYVDKNSSQRFAKNVQLTDEAVADVGPSERLIGVIETVFSRGSRYGLIRSIAHDEKIFWSGACMKDKKQEKQMNEGACVSFNIRRRGGLRTAVNIEIASDVSKEEIVHPGMCLAVVVGSALSVNSQSQEQYAIPLDTANEAALDGKFWNFHLADSMSQHAHARQSKALKKNSNRSEWERKDLAKEDEAAEDEALSESVSAVIIDTPLTAAAAEAPVPTTKAANKEAIDAKYYAALPRTRIPLEVTTDQASYTHTSSDGTSITLPGFEPGTLVYCQAVTSFLTSREPLRMVNPVAAAGHALNDKLKSDLQISIPKKGRLMKRRGVITKLNVRVKADSSYYHSNEREHGPVYDGVELTEIRELPSNLDPVVLLELGQMTTNTGDSVFYCEAREIVTPAATGRESLLQGDEVEFYGVVASHGAQSTNIAAYTHMSPRRDKEGIVFKRSVNSDLKASLSQQTVQAKPRGVVMARGPAEDGSTGFPSGWRCKHLSTMKAAEVPWAHLLPHIDFGAPYAEPTDLEGQK